MPLTTAAFDWDFDRTMYGPHVHEAARIARECSNNFERLRRLSEGSLKHMELRGCLANARELCNDGGGNIWFEHLSPWNDVEWVFCMDHEDGSIFAFYAAAVFEAISDGGDVDRDLSEDDDHLRAVFAEKHPGVDPGLPSIARDDARQLWDRSEWLMERFYRPGSAAVPHRGVGSFEQELAQPDYADQPALALYWLFHQLHAGDAASLDRALEAARPSALLVVRDACAHVASLR